MTTIDRHGESLQTIQPDRTLTAGPIQLQAGVPLSPNNLLGDGAVYLFCKSIIHVSSAARVMKPMPGLHPLMPVQARYWHAYQVNGSACC
ncbi:hypothetical protein ACNFIC_21250 [Pseudomonas sp. NY15463]|uniref:hypothetical protein n=1 Tax=Pseudomonas sp. NY15463 TaxID=3400361 RepID=UPI003A8AA32D